MAENPLLLLKKRGQSVWLDDLARTLLQNGKLEAYIRDDGLSGITSNPVIFRNAITGSDAYDGQMGELSRGGASSLDIYEQLAIQDVQNAADMLRPAFEESKGTDGFVSLEVSPHLARDVEGTVKEARRLWKALDRPNVFIKIPGTMECVPAIERCLTEGININITLLFSLKAHEDVMEAYLRAMEARKAKGLRLDNVASVASFFLSRIDVKVDKRLEEIAKAGGPGAEKVKGLAGKCAIASARLAYQNWKSVFSGDRWSRLESAGARPQKALWASTSTKNPSYPDVMYVETLIGPSTINTMPGQTLDAFRDHGRVDDTLDRDSEGQKKVMSDLEAAGISVARVTDELVDEGIDKFIKPFDELLGTIEEKRATLTT